MRTTFGKAVFRSAAIVMILVSCTPEQADKLREFLRVLAGNTQTFHIAFMGDSYAAGEGNPDDRLDDSSPNTITWGSLQCHRSFENGRNSAVETLDDPEHILFAIESDDASCSGATINEGLLAEYRGLASLENPFDPLPPQVSQIRGWLDSQRRPWMSKARQPKLDALVITTGGNDIGFGQIVAECLSGVAEPCQVNYRLDTLVFDGDVNDSKIVGLDNLDEAYRSLDEAIRSTFQPNVPMVILVGYPDPLRNEDEEFCDAFDEHFAARPEHLVNGSIQPTSTIEHWLPLNAQMRFITQDESEWIFNNVVQALNRKMRSSAEELGWVFVGGLEELTRRHGYCSADPWFNTLKASFVRQGDVNGAAHPNDIGYLAYQQVIIKALVENLSMDHVPPPAVHNDPYLMLIDHRGIELSKSQVGFPESPVRVRATVLPTASRILGVTLEYATNRPSEQAFSTGAFLTLAAQNDADTFAYPDIFTADIPGDGLRACDWVHYRWRVAYSWNGETYSTTGAVSSYRIASPLDSELHPICDPIP